MQNIKRMNPDDLADEAFMSVLVFDHGWRPAIHNLQGLVPVKKQKSTSPFETCGAYHVNGESWITVSPKWAKPPIRTLERVDEYKIIVEDETSIEKWSEALSTKTKIFGSGCTLNGQRVRSRLFLIQSPPGLRGRFQTHKLYFADQSDDQSARSKSPSFQ